MGIVSLGPVLLRRLRVVFLGGATSLGSCDPRSGGPNGLRPGGTVSPGGSELTTTMGGAGDALSPEYLRSEFTAVLDDEVR